MVLYSCFKKKKAHEKVYDSSVFMTKFPYIIQNIVVGLSANQNEDIITSSLSLAYYLLPINSMSFLERETSSGLINLQLSLSIKSGYNFFVRL